MPLGILIDLNTFILAATAVINLGLAVLIYLNNRKNEINISFSLLLFALALWVVISLIEFKVEKPELVLLFERLGFAIVSFIPALAFHFTLVFPKGLPLARSHKRFIYSLAVIFSLFSLTPLVVAGVWVKKLIHPFFAGFVYGPVYYLLLPYFVLLLGAAVVNLIKNFLRAAGEEKTGLFYVLFGGGTLAVVATATNLILPTFGISNLVMIGPLATVFMAGFVSYAIVKHRLLEIENFLSQGIFYLTFIGLIGGTTIALISRDFAFLLYFYVLLANFSLGLFVLLQNWRSSINRTFSFITLLTAFWILSIFILFRSREMAQYIFWGKMAFAAPSLIPSTFLYFTRVFPKRDRPLVTIEKFLLIIPALFFLLLTPTNAILKDVFVEAGRVNPVVGWAYPLFIIYFVIYMGYGLVNLIQKYNLAKGLERVQVGYFLLGASLSAFIGMLTNLILPFLGNARFTELGPLSTIFLVAFTAYAIVRHRLMGIDVVIQRGLIYTVAAAAIATLYALAIFFSEQFLRGIIGYSGILMTILAALIIALTFQPFIRFLQDITDRIFFRGRYDYQKTLRDVSSKIASIIRLEQLANLIVGSFLETMRVSEISLLLYDKDRHRFRSVSIDLKEALPRYKRIEMDERSPIISWLKIEKSILIKDEVDTEIERLGLVEGGEERKKNLEEVRDELDRIAVVAWIPIISKEELIGIITLGYKLSGDMFTDEDLGLLTTLANQAAVAIENAELYDEILSLKNYAEGVLQSMTNGVLTTNLEGKVITFNKMAEYITGLKISEVVGKSCNETWGEKGIIAEVICNTIKGRTYLNFEANLSTKERGLVPISLSTTLLKDSKGKNIGALVVIADLSEVKALEAKVRQADKLASLGTMAAGMAHEIKNPLSSMKVLAQLMSKKFEDEEYRKKFTDIMPREIARIDRIVESLLGFARATQPKFEKLKIDEVIGESLKIFEPHFEPGKIKVIKEFAHLPEIMGDREQLLQVLNNLILNAIQAMPEGGELKLVTKEAAPGIAIEVSDTGHGIPREHLKKLFDPFFTTKYGGAGLGLSIAHSIIDGHKGSIEVKSEVGKGTTFIITLPVSQV